MDDRTRKILFGFALAGGALVLSATTAGAQSDSGSSNSPAPKSSVPFDDGPGSGGAPHSGCNGMHEMPDTGGASSTDAAAQLT
jgi:hypothetical protein